MKDSIGVEKVTKRPRFGLGDLMERNRVREQVPERRRPTPCCDAAAGVDATLEPERGVTAWLR